MKLELILNLHKLSLRDYGGGDGIRDYEMLDSAIQRPFQTFGGQDLYPTVFEKAAAIGESIIINHPFIDGNKRIGLLAILYILSTENLKLTATKDELYQFIIDISTGTTRYDEIVAWLQKHV